MAEMKNTKQRGAILHFLENSPDPVSAEEIFVLLKPSFPQLALSTIYRNLERFTESGILQRINFEDGVIRYALAKGHDHYLICTGCSKKIKLDDCPLSPLEMQLAHKTGFQIERHSLTIYGKCPDCQKKKTAHNKSEAKNEKGTATE